MAHPPLVFTSVGLFGESISALTQPMVDMFRSAPQHLEPLRLFIVQHVAKISYSAILSMDIGYAAHCIQAMAYSCLNQFSLSLFMYISFGSSYHFGIFSRRRRPSYCSLFDACPVLVWQQLNIVAGLNYLTLVFFSLRPSFDCPIFSSHDALGDCHHVEVLARISFPEFPETSDRVCFIDDLVPLTVFSIASKAVFGSSGFLISSLRGRLDQFVSVSVFVT
jgi:hypothetical protein